MPPPTRDCPCFRACCIRIAGCCGLGCCSLRACISSRPAWWGGCEARRASRLEVQSAVLDGFGRGLTERCDHHGDRDRWNPLSEKIMAEQKIRRTGPNSAKLDQPPDSSQSSSVSLG